MNCFYCQPQHPEQSRSIRYACPICLKKLIRITNEAGRDFYLDHLLTHPGLELHAAFRASGMEIVSSGQLANLTAIYTEATRWAISHHEEWRVVEINCKDGFTFRNEDGHDIEVPWQVVRR